jgi:hypothetical protein
MIFSYRTRKFFSTLAGVLLILLLIVVLIWMVWIVWLDRFVVYTRDGAQIDFSNSVEGLYGEPVVPPEALPGIGIVYDDSSSDITVSTELTQIYGYYADVAALKGSMEDLMAQVNTLPAGTPVMVDMKTIYGYFLYSTDLGPLDSAMDISAMDRLIAAMADRDLYMIARVPAFRDYYFGLNYTSNGLFRGDGYALWTDFSSGYLTYWLDPTRDGTITYLTQIANELKRMGFDEVVFSEFRFPETDKIVYRQDKQEALKTALDTLLNTCGTSTFTLSFTVADPTFQLPDGRSRIYLEGVPADQVGATASRVTVTNPEVRLVFVSTTNDTRYDDYGVLRPIASADVLEDRS